MHSAQTAKTTAPRSLQTIAREISTDWKKPNFGAVPYLRAMHCLRTVHDYYGLDSAKEIVLYFLANAQTWRGERARAIKAELKALVGGA